MRTWFVTPALALIACSGSSGSIGPAPSNPGVQIEEATTYEGDAYVPADGELVFTETASGTQFNFAGQAFDGALADDKVQLAVLPGMAAFWFAWSTHHPGARVWNNGVNNDGQLIAADATCGVPCDEIIGACFGGRDCIPSIDSPRWTTTDDQEGLDYLVDEDRILGIARGGAARAYPLDTLWTHEIVNDTWGDWDFSVTYCPLTGSGILADGNQAGLDMEFGVSGNLFNSNLVMYDRNTQSLYGQMRMVGIQGERLGQPLEVAGLIDTTWGEWRRMYPQTEVLHRRHAAGYPYGDYREDDADTFIINNPRPDGKYPNKSYAIGLIAGGETVIWAFEELQAELGSVGIVEDNVGGLPVLVAYDATGPSAVVFSRLRDGQTLSFEQVP
ncbi:MAG: DUF3179 domain-containing protein [Myxococcales bacterium]|nr:DUF3179 domain-containing protein [Myxococcales bacterium]